jgi:hypothetical protein
MSNLVTVLVRVLQRSIDLNPFALLFAGRERLAGDQVHYFSARLKTFGTVIE